MLVTKKRAIIHRKDRAFLAVPLKNLYHLTPLSKQELGHLGVNAQNGEVGLSGRGKGCIGIGPKNCGVFRYLRMIHVST